MNNTIFEFKGYRIVPSDAKNLEIQQHKQVKVKNSDKTRPEWVWVGYYSSLSDALKALVGFCGTSCATIEDAIASIEDLRNHIDNTLK